MWKSIWLKLNATRINGYSNVVNQSSWPSKSNIEHKAINIVSMQILICSRGPPNQSLNEVVLAYTQAVE